MSSGRRYRPEEAERVLERAARIQAERELAHTDEVTTADLTTAAEQAGISSSALLAALAEERGLQTEPVRQKVRRAGGVEVRLQLPTAISEAAVDRAWDVAIRERKELGYVERLGNSRVWRPKAHRSDGFELGVRRGDVSTDVWVRRRVRSLEQSWLPWVALGSLFAMGLRNPLSILMGAALFLAVRWGVRALAARRLEGELERLVEEIEAEVRRPDPEP